MRVAQFVLIAFRVPVLLSLAACSSSLNWARDRYDDVRDIADFKFGTGCAGGGVKVEAAILSSGLGFNERGRVRESFGRLSYLYSPRFYHFVIVGIDGCGIRAGPEDPNERTVFLVLLKSPEGIRPSVQRYRFGGEIIIPGVTVGAYLNGGELVDCLLGFFGIDLARDDGVPRSTIEIGESDSEPLFMP